MRLKSFLVPLAVLALSIGARAQFVRVEGREFLRPDGKVLDIRGTNLGNWLVPEGYMWRLDGAANSPREIENLLELLLGPDGAAAFWNTYRDRYVTRADIDFLARTGCNTVRVPLHYKFFRHEHDEGFRLLDRVIGWCRDAGLYVILDLHCAPGGQTGTNIDDSLGYPWLFESQSAQAELLTVWENLARHYRDEPVVLGYDLLNEPLPAYPGWERYKPRLEPLMQRILAAVRTIDTHHVVILTGANWDTDFRILGAPPGENLAYTFHKYHTPPQLGAIREYLDFRQRYNVPIWAGETGENSDAWIADFRRLLEENRIGWTFWPYKKMESTAGFVRFARPVHWDRIVEFAKQPLGSGSDAVKASLPKRPSPQEIQESFADLLRLVDFTQCTPNRGYIEALGLKVP